MIPAEKERLPSVDPAHGSLHTDLLDSATLTPLIVPTEFRRKKVAEHQRAERARVAAAKEAERLRAEVAEAKQRRAELQRTVSSVEALL